MTWIALDCDLPEHPKFAALPSDAARYSWIVILTRAKRQSKPGQFASEAHFREVVHRHAKYLAHYLSTRLLERHEDGSLAVHDWQQYQWKAAKERQREDNGETNTGQTEDKKRTSRARSAVPVPVPVDVSSSSGVVKGDDDEPEFPLLQWLAKHGCYVAPGNGYHRQLITAVERHGAPAVERMFDKLSRAGVVDGDIKGFVFGATDNLNPKPNLRALSEADREDEAKAAFDRRVERTRKETAALRQHLEN